MVSSKSGDAQNSDLSNNRAIHVQFVNNFTTESPHSSVWSGAILDIAKIILRNNMMTVCILMLSLPTTIMNIYVDVTARRQYSRKLRNPLFCIHTFCHFFIAICHMLPYIGIFIRKFRICILLILLILLARIFSRTISREWRVQWFNDKGGRNFGMFHIYLTHHLSVLCQEKAVKICIDFYNVKKYILFHTLQYSK